MVEFIIVMLIFFAYFVPHDAFEEYRVERQKSKRKAALQRKIKQHAAQASARVDPTL